MTTRTLSNPSISKNILNTHILYTQASRRQRLQQQSRTLAFDMLRRSAQQIASNLVEQLCITSSAAASSCSSWQALRGICGTPCTQRKLFPPTVPARSDDGEEPRRWPGTFAAVAATAVAAAAATAAAGACQHDLPSSWAAAASNVAREYLVDKVRVAMLPRRLGAMHGRLCRGTCSPAVVCRLPA